MRRAQLQFFEHLKRSHALIGQIGVTSAGMDGPALMGLPTLYLTDARNVRMREWVGIIPGYQEGRPWSANHRPTARPTPSVGPLSLSRPLTEQARTAAQLRSISRVPKLLLDRAPDLLHPRSHRLHPLFQGYPIFKPQQRTRLGVRSVGVFDLKSLGHILRPERETSMTRHTVSAS